MKSNWEAKAKISEDYELERRRLEAEQKAAARELAANKEKSWKLLEEKGDIELSSSHVRGLVKSVSWFPGGGDTSISGWMPSYKELMKLEQKLSEQDTMAQVYRTALEKDCSTILKVKD